MRKFIPIILGLFLFTHSSLFAIKAIILLGPPGSGKGTQSILIKEAIGWNTVSFSNILREEKLKEQSDLLDAYREYRTRPDVINKLKFATLKNEIANLPKTAGVIFDGWPKNLPSLNMLLTTLCSDAKPLVIELEAKREILINRATQRMVCTNAKCGKTYGPKAIYNNDDICQNCYTPLKQKKKDNKKDFPHRLDKYFAQQHEIHRAFRENNILINNIDADRNYEDVYEDIYSLVKKYLNKEK